MTPISLSPVGADVAADSGPLRARPRWRTGAALAASAWLAACSQLPTYQRPEVALPSAWPVQASATPAADGTAATEPLAWQDFVREPTLKALIEQALVNNRDLRVAALQIEQARAQYQIRQADRWPTVNAGVTGSRQTAGEDEPIKSTYTAGLLVSGWEADLFGRIASLKEAALAQFLASEETRKALQTSLVGSVASTWLSLQANEAQLELTRQTLASREEGLRLIRLRYEHGAASALDLRAAESLAATARATLAQQQRLRQLDVNALALLVGQPLDQALQPAARPEAVATTEAQAVRALAEVPVGLPSQVLLQRSDVRAAEQQLVAANAQIGAARAAFFPRISLTASMGSASSELSGLFKSGTWGWTLAPQALLPIFDAGRNQAGLASAQAGQQVALAQYEKAIQTAFREVNDALAGQATLADQLQAQQQLAQAEAQRLRLSELRLQQGVASQLELLDAQRSVFAAQQTLLQTRLALAQNRVALFKALGGGWR